MAPKGVKLDAKGLRGRGGDGSAGAGRKGVEEKSVGWVGAVDEAATGVGCMDHTGCEVDGTLCFAGSAVEVDASDGEPKLAVELNGFEDELKLPNTDFGAFPPKTDAAGALDDGPNDAPPNTELLVAKFPNADFAGADVDDGKVVLDPKMLDADVPPKFEKADVEVAIGGEEA